MILDQIEEVLEAAGLEFSHVFRTWFYNNKGSTAKKLVG
jgi:hypothetical protein